MTSHAPVTAPTLEAFQAARENVADIAIETPVLHSNYLSTETGVEVYLKAENLQRTGAYKLRGAYNRISKLSTDERARGVVAASAGNHAQGVALAATKLGIKATIFMPVGASLPKVQATRGYGAEVVLTGANFAEALAASQAFAAETNAVFIPPFDNIDVVTGQGTVALEVFEQVPDVENIIVAIGGGGLAAGVAVAAKLEAARQGRTVKVFGVQSEHAAAYPPSLAAGHEVEIQTSATIADGIAVSKPGHIPFELIRANIDEVVTVSENEIAKAILTLLERAKQVVEPAGAVGVAALLSGAIKPVGTTVAILSGGNIDPMLLQKVIHHGLAASERYINISVMLPDRPGQLVATASAIAAAGGNVLEVLHTRHGNAFQISAVELNVSVETGGHEHSLKVLQALKDAGLNPRLNEARVE